MSTEAPSFIVAVELTPEYVTANEDIFDGMMKAGFAYVAGREPVTFRFRAQEPINGVVTLAPGCTVRNDEPDLSNDASLTLLSKKLLARLRATDTRRDEPKFTAEWDGTDNQPTPDEYDAWNKEQECHDEPPRASVNPDEPQPATNAAPKKGAISLGELMESEDSSDATICAPLGISFGDRPMLIVGAFGTAKTWIMIKLALEFATERPLFGNSAWPIERPLRVYIFDYELNRIVYKRRLRQLCETMGIDYQTIRERIYYYQRPKFYLTDQNAYDRFLEETKDFDVILGDALRGAAPDVDENKSEFRKNLDILHDVATTGNKFVCWLHHAGKDENKGFRGTSGIGDAAGVMFTVTNDPKDRKGPKKFHHDKLGTSGDDFIDDFFILLKRDGEDGNGPMRIDYMSEKEANKQSVEKAEEVSKEEFRDRMRQVASIVAKKPGISQNEIIKAAKANSGTIKNVIKYLCGVKCGFMENKGTATSHEYVITTAGQEWLDKHASYARHTPGPAPAPTNPSTTNAPESSAPDDAPPIVETGPEQASESNAAKTQSNVVDENVKKVVEYVRDNPGCSKSEIKGYIKIRDENVVAARDKAERQGLISWSKRDGSVITDKGRALLGLTPSVATAPPSAPQDAPTTPDTAATSDDAPKGA